MRTTSTAIAVLTTLLLASSPSHASLLAWLAGDTVNGPDGRVILDSSVNANHAAVLQNTQVVPDGYTGGGIDFGDGGSHMIFNTSTAGAFDSIVENQEFTVAFWLAGEESAVAPNNQSVFWFESPANNGTARGIQAHVPWSNSQVYLDIGGCCSATQRLNGVVDRDFFDATVGDEWSHWTFTMTDAGDAAIYVDGEELYFRAGPTDAIGDFAQIWFGGAINGGNSFAGRLDDVVIADNALDFDEVFTLYDEGPAALWADDILADGPADFVPAVPVIPNVNVNGEVVVASEIIDGKQVGTINDFAQYVLTIDGDFIDADHILVNTDTTVGNTVLDLNNAKLKVEIQGEFTVGDDFVLFFADEVQNIDTINWDFPDSGLFDLSGLTPEGGFRITYVGENAAAALAIDCNGDGTTDLTCGLEADFDGSGLVDFSDFLILSGNYGQEVISYSEGDVDGNGIVDFGDFLVLSGNFGAGVAGTAAVPEPSSMLMLSVLGLLCFGLRTRNR